MLFIIPLEPKSYFENNNSTKKTISSPPGEESVRTKLRLLCNP